jgi:hypothetical protein
MARVWLLHRRGARKAKVKARHSQSERKRKRLSLIEKETCNLKSWKASNPLNSLMKYHSQLDRSTSRWRTICFKSFLTTETNPCTSTWPTIQKEKTRSGRLSFRWRAVIWSVRRLKVCPRKEWNDLFRTEAQCQ